MTTLTSFPIETSTIPERAVNTALQDTDLFITDQGGSTKQMSGAVSKQGHGGIIPWTTDFPFLSGGYCDRNGVLYRAKQSHSNQDPELDIANTYWDNKGNTISLATRGVISGGAVSNGTDSDHDLDITVFTTIGKNARLIQSSGVITKAIDSSYVKSSAGGLDSNDSLTVNTTYHCLAILFDDGVVDWAYTTDLTGASLLGISGAVDVQHLWSVVTDSSSNIINFIQHYDRCDWKTPILEFNGASTVDRVVDAISVPSGFPVEVDFNIHTLVNGAHYFSSPDAVDLGGSLTVNPFMTWGMSGATNDQGGSKITGILTNSSSEIARHSALSVTLRYVTLGFKMKRGQL